MAERSLTRAACDQLMTLPAANNALSSLRDTLGDD